MDDLSIKRFYCCIVFLEFMVQKIRARIFLDFNCGYTKEIEKAFEKCLMLN